VNQVPSSLDARERRNFLVARVFSFGTRRAGCSRSKLDIELDGNSSAVLCKLQINLSELDMEERTVTLLLLHVECAITLL